MIATLQILTCCSARCVKIALGEATESRIRSSTIKVGFDHDMIRAADHIYLCRIHTFAKRVSRKSKGAAIHILTLLTKPTIKRSAL